MNKPQTRKEKIALLKEVAKGNRSTLNAVIEERNRGVVSFTNIIRCFYYLLEHGRPDGYTGALQYQKCCITSMEDLKDIESGLEIFSQTGECSRISSEALNMMLECMECYWLLKENG